MNFFSWIRSLLFRKPILVKDVFTPSSAATLTYVERIKIENQINRALDTEGKQLVIYGHSGSGKSTLIKNILTQRETRYIKSICSKDYTFEKLLKEAIFKVGAYYKTEIVYKDSTELSYELSSLEGIVSIAGKTGIEKEQTYKRAVNIELSTGVLGKALSKANAIWIIEDFHKVNQAEKEALADNLKILYDTGAIAIAIGAVGEARQVVAANKELGNSRVSEIAVPLMLDSELMQIINKGEQLLNIEIDELVKEKIIQFSFGLASVCHQLCLNLCYVKNVNKALDRKINFNIVDLNRAVDLYVQDASDTLKRKYDDAIRIEEDQTVSVPKEILITILNSELEEISSVEIFNLLNETSQSFVDKSIKKYLSELTSEARGEVLRFDNASNKYSLNDPFFVAYFLSRIQKEIQFKIPRDI